MSADTKTEAAPDVRAEDGWFVAYDDRGGRIARFGSRPQAEAACARMRKRGLGGSLMRTPGFTAHPPKEAAKPHIP